MMNIQKNYLLLLGMICSLVLFSCKDKEDDDNMQEDPPVVNPLESCCEFPRIQSDFGGGVYFPNAFTPNGDGINDLYFVNSGSGIEQVNAFKIYMDDTLIFERNNVMPNTPTLGWDGRQPDGTDASEGVYQYQITVSDLGGASQQFEGEVCLRRGFPIDCVDFEEQCNYGTQHNGEGDFDQAAPSQEECN